MKLKPFLVAAAVLISVGAGCAVRPAAKTPPAPSAPAPAPVAPAAPETAPAGKIMSDRLPKDLDFGLGFVDADDKRYTLVHLATGASRPFLPQGYRLLSQNEYRPFPTQLILRKGGQLYAYDVASEALQPILPKGAEMGPYDAPDVFPSVTEDGKFEIDIAEYPTAPHETEMGGDVPPASRRQYFFDAATDALTPHRPNPGDTSFSSCRAYDSKNRRFFRWPCGEGIGNAAPVTMEAFDGKPLGTAVGASDFGPDASNETIHVRLQRGRFLAWNESTRGLQALMIVDPAEAKTAIRTLKLGQDVQAILHDGILGYAYSADFDDASRTLVFGGAQQIMLARADGNDLVSGVKTLPEPDIYANFVYVGEGQLVYQNRGVLKAIDLASWEPSLALPGQTPDVGITLFRHAP